MNSPELDFLDSMTVSAYVRLFYPELELVSKGTVWMALVGELLVARGALERPMD
ncbi:MAG: hypothetical protein HY755_09680 [Nitrospirae bacterium]|nr:hypothetical protein [Nitrospirota bacterium]